VVAAGEEAEAFADVGREFDLEAEFFEDGDGINVFRLSGAGRSEIPMVSPG
jgi:hypothetical protein